MRAEGYGRPGRGQYGRRVAHRRMYQDDDRLLAEVRRVCLALPEAVEVEAWGRPTFRAGKMFALFTGTPEHPSALLVQADDEERLALLADDRFFLAPYFRSAPWIALDLGSAPIDWAEVEELAETSYRRVAPGRLIAQLDAS
jgi:hypothetical protein